MKVIIGLLTFILLFINPFEVQADVSAIINNVNPSEISDKEQEIQIDTTLTGLPTSDSYIRVSLDGGVSYIGYMKNNLDGWVKIDTLDNDKKDGQCVKYFKVNLNGNYILRFKIGSENNVTNETRILKIHRFTETCKTASDIGNTTIVVKLPTPTPSSTQAPTAQPTNQPTLAPTSTTTPKPTQTPIQSGQAKTSTPKSTSSPIPTPTESGQADEPITFEKNDSIILPTPTSTGLVAGASTSNNKSKTIAITLIFFGVCFLGYCGFLIYNSKNAKVEGSS